MPLLSTFSLDLLVLLLGVVLKPSLIMSAILLYLSSNADSSFSRFFGHLASLEVSDAFYDVFFLFLQKMPLGF